MRGGAVTLMAVLSTACVGTSSEVCPDGTVCANDRRCVYVPAPAGIYACADSGQLAACAGAAEGDACMLGDERGTCYGGGCIVPICGDGILSPGLEVCDDGNSRSGDGCSLDCQSDETCGNGYTDLVAGEQCDDGALGLSGDGCSAHCLTEYDNWRDVTPENPDMRFSAGYVGDLARGVLMVGGTSQNGTMSTGTLFSDLWRWDGATWQELASPVPLTRRLDVAIANDRHGRIVVYGGAVGGGTPSDETWTWDGVSWQLRATASAPPARFGAALACAPGPGVACMLFGGTKSMTPNNESWAWDGTSWSQLIILGNVPQARRDGQLVYDPIAGRYILFGGFGASLALSDTWVYSGGSWTQLLAAGGPVGYTMLSATWDETNKRIVLVTNAQTWTFDGTTWTNLNIAPPAGAPQLAWDTAAAKVIAISPDLANAAMKQYHLGAAAWQPENAQTPNKGSHALAAAYDELRGVTVVADASTFEWNGTDWRRTVTANPMSENVGTALAYDAHCGVVVSFGGSETYHYPKAGGGIGWTPITATPPPPRTHHAMAYDRARDAIVVFGGVQMDDTYLGDTWELTTSDCATWTWHDRTPATGPTPRWDAPIAYDARRGTTVLFGGLDALGTPLADTWEWDGTAWTERATGAGTPPARGDAMLAYDPRRQRVVLFGGRDLASHMSDSWEWDGDRGRWEQIAPASRPTVRSGAGFATDITGGLVAFLGENGSGNGVGTTTRLFSELSTETRETCVTGEDADGDGLAACADPDCWARCTPACPPGTTCAPTDPRCGDGACDPLEDYMLCPADCQAPP